jgi:hypothetical protein
MLFLQSSLETWGSELLLAASEEPQNWNFVFLLAQRLQCVRGKILATVQRGKPKKIKNSSKFCQPAGWNRLLSKFGNSRKKIP